MGLACSKKQRREEEEDGGAPIVRLSPFRPRRLLSRSRSFGGAEAAGPGPQHLLSLALDALLRSLHRQPAHALARLPPDLSQLLLEALVACGQLDDAAVLKLSGLGLHFFRLPLGAYPERVQPSWLRCLSTPSLEAADLSKTEASVRAGQPASQLSRHIFFLAGCLPALARGRGEACQPTCLPACLPACLLGWAGSSATRRSPGSLLLAPHPPAPSACAPPAGHGRGAGQPGPHAAPGAAVPGLLC